LFKRFYLDHLTRSCDPRRHSSSVSSFGSGRFLLASKLSILIMGIQGLLPFLKSIQRESHLKKWAGHTFAVDGYVWLHRAAYSCAQELCLGNPTNKHVNYFVEKIKLLRKHGVSAYVVFDGDQLPSKAVTENDRSNRRQVALARANKLLSQGDKEKAREEFVKALDVTPQLAHDVILALRSLDVKFVVAPYEADAQLRYLEMMGQVSGIITEDSDLLVYGAKNVLFKLDSYGNCIHVCRDDFGAVKDKRMSLWTDREFRQMAMLSGCDYLPSIPGLGIKRAYELIRRFQTAERAIKATRLEGKLSVPQQYEKRFHEAEMTFLYQLVYDPSSRSLVPLHPLSDPPPPLESLSGCGQRWADEVAVGVAEGNLDPCSKLPFSSMMSETSQRRPDTQQKKRLRHPSQKQASVFFGNQPTLKNFAFTTSGPERLSSNSKSSLDVLEPLDNVIQSSKQSTYFFGSQLNNQTTSYCSSAAENSKRLQVEATDQSTIQVIPLEIHKRQERATQVLTHNGEASAADKENFESFMTEDLPSSQMHSSQISTTLRVGATSIENEAPISSPSTVKRPDSVFDEPLHSSIPLCSSQEDDNVYNLLSDGAISSEPDDLQPSLSCSKVSLITPDTRPALTGMKRRVSEPVSRRAFPPISSDPILSSDEDKHKTYASRPHGTLIVRHSQPVKKICSGFRDTPTSHNRSASTAIPEEEMSPSLARIASGIRSRFTYRPSTRSKANTTTVKDGTNKSELKIIQPKSVQYQRASQLDKDARSLETSSNDNQDDLSKRIDAIETKESPHCESNHTPATAPTTSRLASFLFKGAV
ncbi:hypothetical protein O181_038234, partial [Austropuccinia psidii MF-1]|nr:hypothetical protein [Austropuccinia psidii MF-1]